MTHFRYRLGAKGAKGGTGAETVSVGKSMSKNKNLNIEEEKQTSSAIPIKKASVMEGSKLDTLKNEDDNSKT